MSQFTTLSEIVENHKIHLNFQQSEQLISNYNELRNLGFQDSFDNYADEMLHGVRFASKYDIDMADIFMNRIHRN